jgi:CarD family transcriptional regulator
MMAFKTGDLAVYPAHGVGRIESIEVRNLYGSSQDFYIMRILENNMIIMIPISNATSVGLREIIKEEEVSKIFKILKEKDVEFDNQSWNRRYREYMEKIKTGSVYEVAQVLRDLFLLKLEKELSFGERKMLDTAKNLLVKEISIAKKMKETQVEEDIKRIFVH